MLSPTSTSQQQQQSPFAMPSIPEMDASQKLKLQEMITANNVLDQTPLIRELRHSHTLRDEVNKLVMLRAQYMDDPDTLHLEAMVECNFLFCYYTDIYNKIRKNEMDLDILFSLIDVLQQIEEGELDQHTGSFKVGELLKKIYIDSALKKAEKMNAEREGEEPEYRGPTVQMSWRDFKNKR